jgi:hypothetical protein
LSWERYGTIVLKEKSTVMVWSWSDSKLKTEDEVKMRASMKGMVKYFL